MKRILFAICIWFYALKVVAIAEAGESGSLSLGYSSLSLVEKESKTPLPSSLMVKYGFSLLKDIKPYVGTGVAYLLPQETKPGEIPAKIKTGLAGQAGIKIDLDIRSSLKIDYKFLHVNPDQTRTENSTSPQSIGIGLEIKF